MLSETAIVDELEGRIIRCVQLAPRVPFRVVADLLGVSEQTIARRYRRLVDTGVLRVTAVVDPTALGQSSWTVRVQCRPDGAVSLAQALARRDDIGWVSLVSGGSEVMCVLRARTSEARDDLLTQRLPRTAPVLGLSAMLVLHRYVGAGRHTTEDWSALDDVLTDDQQRVVLTHSGPERTDRAAPLQLTREDLQLLDALVDDGRASYARLAVATGREVGQVTRRLRALIEAGAAYLDVDVSTEALGFATAATLWLTVAPADLHRVGTALAGEREVAFAAAVSGPQNLYAAVVCRDVEHLYSFVTDRVGGIDGVRGLEIMPTLRTVKQAGTLMSEGRLAGRPT